MNLEIIIDDDEQTVAGSYSWGSDQRLPVVGEFIQIGRAEYVVTRVEWVLTRKQVAGYVPVQQAALYVEAA